MNKKQLKALIEGFNPGDKISITMLGEFAHRSGDYSVVEVTTGRGKGGSKMVKLEAADGTFFTTGTPKSDDILHVVTADGMLHGFENTSDVPRIFEPDAAKHDILKPQMQELVGTTGARIRILDSENEFCGEYIVTQAEQLRGRYGQVQFTLLDDAGRTQLFWSWRHSGIVTSFEVLSIPTQDTIPTLTTETN